MSTWNKRAVQGALIRLDQTGMVKRFRARRKDAEENWLTCIEVLREPRPEDHENLKFRRQAVIEEAEDEQSDEDVDGDTMMRDLEVDMLNIDSKEADGSTEDAGRVPPQWVPERLLSNTLHEVVAMGGPEGWDAGVLRDRIVGKFWRRPMESYLSRLTDDWEATQPAHLRHLALIRDTRNTQEKKFVHYVYRTYGNFQKAVDAGEVIWAGVSKPAPKQSTAAKGGRPKKAGAEQHPIDAWGFRSLNPKDFLNADGSGSLTSCRAAIVHVRKYGPRWDNSIVEDIGYQKVETPKPDRSRRKSDASHSKAKAQSRLTFSAIETPSLDSSPATPIRQGLIADAAADSEDMTLVATTKVMGLPKRKYDTGLLTIEQRIALGLKPRGRLSKFVEDQILEHRKSVGDSNSIPESIELERPTGTPAPPKLGPLMSKDERIAAGLPPRGRLGQKIEDQIREQRGFPKSAEKSKKPRKSRPANEPALLSKEQRIKLGIIPHGRLPQSLMEGLREERELHIPLEESNVVPTYLSAVKDRKNKAELTRAIDQTRVQTQRQHGPNRGLNQDDAATPAPDEDDKLVEVDSSTNSPSIQKRKASDDDTTASQPSKRLRVEQESPVVEADKDVPTPPTTISADVNELAEAQVQPSLSRTNVEDVETGPHTTGSSHQTRHQTSELLPNSSAIIDLSDVKARLRLIKETYSNRSAPGFYADPFAKRKTGHGRPRNAFIATFRLRQLSTLQWFTEKPNVNLDDAKETSPRHSSAFPVADGPLGPRSKGLAASTSISNRVSPEPANAAVADDCTSQTSPSAANPSLSHRSFAPISSGSLSRQVLEAPESDQPLAVNEATVTAPRTVPGMGMPQGNHQSVQPSTRAVAGWNAVNRPLQPTTTYQSPYAPSEHLDPGSTNEPIPEDEAIEGAAQDSVDESQIQGLCGPITEEDTTSRSVRKLAAYMGTKMGGGSQRMFRHKIIMQIIDLCNGAYPMHGEIGRPFTTLWNQQHPTITPPGSSTVLSNLRDMIADPRNGLRKLTFLMKLRNSTGVRKRDMVVYQHLTPTSPVVTKLAYRMANFSNSKAHQYYPEEIRHLVTDESFYVPMPVAPKDETISLERLNPSLQFKIKEANLERRRRYYHQQKDEETARDTQNAGVEAPLQKASTTDGQPRAKRARLASLNDRDKRYRRAPLTNTPAAPMDPELEADFDEEDTQDETRASQTLAWKEPLEAPIVGNDAATEAQQQYDPLQRNLGTEYHISSITVPIVRFYATNGTFSTEFGLIREADMPDIQSPSIGNAGAVAKSKGMKRVRIIEPASQRPNKKARVNVFSPEPVRQATLANSSSEESDNSYSSSTSSSSDSEDDIPLMQLSKGRAMAKAKAKAKVKAKAKAKARQRRGKNGPPPTLLERLTGLTGDPNDSVYLPPKPGLSSQKKSQSWEDRKRARINRLQREQHYPESRDPVDKFKKLTCTLVIASSMAGGAGLIDWRIVEIVHNDKGFDLAKTKALWGWMQVNMATQIAQLTANFEDCFVEAYENDRIAAIEDPSTYNWAKLVRWAMHTCVYPELSLPVYREALQQFIVDLSSFEVLDRPKWYREKIADRVRSHLQLQYPHTAPLHQKTTSRLAIDETELKARSWIRANTATPQFLYDSNTAHAKLMLLGNPVLTKVVGDYVDRQVLRMRKLKRLLPGRNYTFTAKLAKKYGRIFELSDFMAAVKVKKEMDAAFVQEDAGKRVYSISRAEPDGAIMAVMSLLSEGKVTYAPQVPSINNEFGAPLPRLSIWGFMEGDYVHRGIDRQRLFWDIHVVPTAAYDYGNPLQPEPAPASSDASNYKDWSPLPHPPMPGRDDSNALLPIWSSMDGQHVTWPWWYRILNLVLQPLIFQPGATVEDIHANCHEYTTEIFEIQLVLQWLVSVNAVKKIIGGGYITLPGMWAAFGDVLHDMENDWLNAHVKRKHQKHQKQRWREEYHLRYSTLQGRSAGRYPTDASDESDVPTDDEREALTASSTNIMRHPKEQYAIVRTQVAAAGSAGSTLSTETTEQDTQPAAAERGPSDPQTAGDNAAPEQDIEMQDDHGTDEVDAEGEWDV